MWFFPLWPGYILVVDGLVERRTGTCPGHVPRRDFVLLFVASSPIWWIFEMINHRTGNWEYLGGTGSPRSNITRYPRYRFDRNAGRIRNCGICPRFSLARSS